MKVSLIIAVYKDVEALSIIVDALKKQTYKNFEVVIAEDGNSQEMKEFIAFVEGLDIIHTTQDDLGIRKSRSVNNGILASTGEYLIFIDGDCIPYSTFIESHVKLSEEGAVLSGRRVNLGPKYTQRLRTKTLSPFQLEKNFVIRYLSIAKDCIEGHSEEGFRFKPNGIIYHKILRKFIKSKNLLGCNYSCYKSSMLKINGYDESYGETAVSDDTDLEWRFESAGYKLNTVRFSANIFHLYHSRKLRQGINADKYLELMIKRKQKKEFVSSIGIKQH